MTTELQHILLSLEQIISLVGSTFYINSISYLRKQTKKNSSSKLPPQAALQQPPCTPESLAALLRPLLPESASQSLIHNWEKKKKDLKTKQCLKQED